jgi:hypothetical protein
MKWSSKKEVRAPVAWKETYPNAEFTAITPENYLEFIG